jgi:hypothetical protein
MTDLEDLFISFLLIHGMIRLAQELINGSGVFGIVKRNANTH